MNEQKVSWSVQAGSTESTIWQFGGCPSSDDRFVVCYQRVMLPLQRSRLFDIRFFSSFFLPKALIHLTKTVSTCCQVHLTSSGGFLPTLLESKVLSVCTGVCVACDHVWRRWRCIHSAPQFLKSTPAMTWPTTPMKDINKWNPQSLTITLQNSSRDSATLSEAFWNKGWSKSQCTWLCCSSRIHQQQTKKLCKWHLVLFGHSWYMEVYQLS